MLVLVIVIMAQWLYWTWKTWRRHGEPPIYPGALPVVGHSYMLLGTTCHLWNKFKEMTYTCLRDGNALYFLMGSQKFYVLTDPDDIYLVSNQCLAKDTVICSLIKELFGSGLPFADVATWKVHRKLITPAFNPQVLDEFLVVFNKQARRFVEKLEPKSNKDFFDHTSYINQILLETICLTAMDVEINERDSLNYIESYEKAIFNGLQKFQKFWLYFDVAMNKQQEQCIQTVKNTSAMILAKKRAKDYNVKDLMNHTKELNRENTKPESSKRFIDLLLNSNTLTDEAIKEEVNGMIIAGSDTTSNVLIFVLITIGSYPEVQQRIYSELEKVFKKEDRDVHKNDLPQLVYLEAVIKETLRYYAMAPFIIRYIDKEIKLKTYTLYPGNNCFLSIHGVHRHSMWGSDAEDFKPERWLQPSTLPENPNAFMAFSVGKRNCIGRSYAMMSLKTILSHIIRNYKIHADHTQMTLKLEVLTKPSSGYFISIEKRKTELLFQ